jgi:5-methyltetrahydropteroyltriglutamate--homocysteine methyltransferase
VKSSTERILTTHVGRLERPEEITSAMEGSPGGRPTTAGFPGKLASAVSEIVRAQANAGIDIVNDGEFGKLGFLSYLHGRLSGFERVPVKTGDLSVIERAARDRRQFPGFYSELNKGPMHFKSPGTDIESGMKWVCRGPIAYVGERELHEDLTNLKAAMNGLSVRDAFVPATSPVMQEENQHYASDEEFRNAAADAIREEYKMIVDAGFVLQVDDPFMPVEWEMLPSLTIKDFRKQAERHVEFINYALRGIPAERIRYHICWGSWHGPHANDIQLCDIVDLLLKVNAQAYLFEAGNVRHEHEWEVWRDVKLPDGKILVPGVVSHATNTVEHPRLVANRLLNFAGVAGRENIIAGTDCGLGYRVHSEIAWAKLGALAEGARIASSELWSSKSTPSSEPLLR